MQSSGGAETRPSEGRPEEAEQVPDPPGAVAGGLGVLRGGPWGAGGGEEAGLPARAPPRAWASLCGPGSPWSHDTETRPSVTFQVSFSAERMRRRTWHGVGMTEGREPALGCSAELRPLVLHLSTQLAFRERGVVLRTRPGTAEAGENGPSPSPAGAWGETNVSLEELSKLFNNQADDAVCPQAWGRPGLRTLGVTHPGLPARHWPHTGQRPATQPPSPSETGLQPGSVHSLAENFVRALAFGRLVSPGGGTRAQQAAVTVPPGHQPSVWEACQAKGPCADLPHR